MTQQEFFKEWSEKYPKCFEKFYNYISDKFNIIYYKYKSKDIFFAFPLTNQNYDYIIKFEMLSGIIEKFFEENDFGFEFRIIKEYSPHKVYFCCSVLNLEPYKDLMLYIFSNVKTKQEAKISAYLKAAEILERELD